MEGKAQICNSLSLIRDAITQWENKVLIPGQHFKYFKTSDLLEPIVVGGFQFEGTNYIYKSNDQVDSNLIYLSTVKFDFNDNISTYDIDEFEKFLSRFDDMFINTICSLYPKLKLK